MSSISSNTQAATFPAAVHIRAIRIGLGLAIAASLLAFAVRAEAQQQMGGVSAQPVASAVSGSGE